MPKLVASSAKMLISLVGRHRGEAFVSVTKAAGARGGTILLGKSLGESKLLRALSLADIQTDVVFTLVGDECQAVIAAIKKAAADNPKKYGGFAILLDVPELFKRVLPGQPVPASTTASETDVMKSGYKLISVIINAGYGDDVMAAARKAGASGGTILNARGTGTEDDVKFFGITLVPEKELLLIVAEEGKAQAIVDAACSVPTLCAPGGGILFNLNVEEFVVLGK